MIKKLLITFSFVAMITSSLSGTVYATHTLAHILKIGTEKAKDSDGKSKKIVKEEETITAIQDRSTNVADEESVLEKQARLLREKKERERIRLERELAKQAILEEAEINKAEREQALLDEKARIEEEKAAKKEKVKIKEKPAKKTGEKKEVEKIKDKASNFKEKIKGIFKNKNKGFLEKIKDFGGKKVGEPG